MTLEDFFTLNEMNNGLTAPSRVMELMTVMQKERNCTVNVGDSTRQWSAVASAIAATENKDCLDLFIQLDGVHFIDKWLKDTQKFSNNTSDSFAEETITQLLQALEKLHVDHENLVGSEVWETVKDLLVHNSSKVQDKARVLFESWKRKRDGDGSILDVEKGGSFADDEIGKSEHSQRGFGCAESSLKDSSLSRDTSNKEIGQESTRDNPVLCTSSGALHSVHVEFASNMDKIIDPPVGDDRHLSDIDSPSASKPIMEPPTFQSVSNSLAESCIPAVARPAMLDCLTVIHESEPTCNAKQIPKTENLPELDSLEKSKTAEDGSFSSSSDAAGENKSVKELSATKNSVAGDKNSCGRGSSFIDARTINTDVKDAMDGCSYENKCRSSSAFSAGEGGEINHHVLGNSSSSVKSWETPKDLGTIPSEVEDDGKIKKLDLHVRDDLTNGNNIEQKEMDGEPSQSGKKTDVESDYGIVDPSEVARKVAIEVEREVVDYREQSYRSEKLPEGNNTGQPDGPDSVTGKQSHASDRSCKDVANDPEFSTEASTMQVESSTSTENLNIELTKGTQDTETSRVTEGAQAEANNEQNLYNFDLNLEVCSEEADLPENQFLAPVSIVSASRAAAAPGLPVSPLQFEGNLGWKGSAATSAFRPASPRRMRESDKDLFIVGSSSSSKQPQGFLEIDLNVAESADGFKGDLLPYKPIPVSSSIPSGESSVETNSRSERLDLDLNLASEDGAPSNWRIGQLFPQGYDHQSRSHSSSSSSKQPSLKIIDLNDQPTFPNDSTDNSYFSKLSQNFNVSGGIKSDDAVISIMGTKVEVNRKEFVPQTITLPNGRTPELTFDVNLGRTGSFLGIGSVVPYAHSSVYGYSNIAPGPAMPFSSTIYGPGGPIPYLVDSRGAPVIPQIVGSASSLPTAYSQPPLVLNMTSSTPSNGVGPSQSSFDLNSGTMVEGGSRDPSGFRQFLNSGPIRSMDDQLRSNALPTVSSGAAGGKRKEPDNGREQYPFRHYTPPWK